MWATKVERSVRAVALAFGLLLAGCAQPQDDPASAEPADDRMAGEEGPVEDLFYLHTGGLSGRGAMDREADGGPVSGNGFASGGAPCERPSPIPVVGGPAANPCWGEVYSTDEPLAAAHAVGEAVHVVLWLAVLAGPAAGQVAVEAWVEARNGDVVAHGLSEAQAAPLAPPVPGESNCAAWSLDLSLQQALPEGEVVQLALMANGVFAQACDGGGEDGSRLDLRGPVTPTETP